VRRGARSIRSDHCKAIDRLTDSRSGDARAWNSRRRAQDRHGAVCGYQGPVTASSHLKQPNWKSDSVPFGKLALPTIRSGVTSAAGQRTSLWQRPCS